MSFWRAAEGVTVTTQTCAQTASAREGEHLRARDPRLGFDAVEAHELLDAHALRRRRLVLGISVNDLARVVALEPAELMDIEAGLRPLQEPEVWERAFAALRRPQRMGRAVA